LPLREFQWGDDPCDRVSATPIKTVNGATGLRIICSLRKRFGSKSTGRYPDAITV